MYLEMIEYSTSDIETSYNVINQLYSEGSITRNVYNYALDVIRLYEKNQADMAKLGTELRYMVKTIKEEKNITDEEKGIILYMNSIASSSVEYWTKVSEEKGWVAPKWLVRDFTGAMTGITTGFVQYAILVTGG